MDRDCPGPLMVRTVRLLDPRGKWQMSTGVAAEGS